MIWASNGWEEAIVTEVYPSSFLCGLSSDYYWNEEGKYWKRIPKQIVCNQTTCAKCGVKLPFAPVVFGAAHDPRAWCSIKCRDET